MRIKYAYVFIPLGSSLLGYAFIIIGKFVEQKSIMKYQKQELVAHENIVLE